MRLLILANLVGVVVLTVLVFIFWSRNLKALSLIHDDAIDILVSDGRYAPSNIYLTVGKPATFRFFRRDRDQNAETVSFDGINTNYRLPLNKPFELKFTPEEIGELSFKGQSPEYCGRIIVVNDDVAFPN